HRGKVAAGTAVLILAAIAYLYHESLYALFVGENGANIKEVVKENKVLTPTPAIQPDLKNMTAGSEKVASVVQQDAPAMPAQENVQAVQPEIQPLPIEKDIVHVAVEET